MEREIMPHLEMIGEKGEMKKEGCSIERERRGGRLEATGEYV